MRFSLLLNIALLFSATAETAPVLKEATKEDTKLSSDKKSTLETPQEIQKNPAAPAATITDSYVIPDGKTIPTIKKVDENTARLGQVLINHKEKSLSFPAQLNLQEGLIEYMVSMPHGKTHETLFFTLADPLHISVASKLISIPSYQGFFPERDDNMEWKPYKKPKFADYKKALVSITASWKQDGKTYTYPISELVSYKASGQTLSEHEWVLIDSGFYNKCYQASVLGDVIAIFGDSNAFISYSGFANEGENVWMANTEKLPKAETPVTITIKRLSETAANRPPSVRPKDPTLQTEMYEEI